MSLKPAGARTVAEYFEQIDEPRQSDVRALDALITKTVPELKPSIQAGMIGYGTYHYKYASGREGDWPVIALASQKSYISLYICATDNGEYVAEKHKQELPKANIGKSCIRFRKLADVDLEVLAKLIRLGAKWMNRTVDARAS
ncbi:MAG: DUF1801 domain-containing protein [Acidobacteria bacterium]|nr:DUF1801 domain-containing protein [Acidobacteriota bacterium]